MTHSHHHETEARTVVPHADVTFSADDAKAHADVHVYGAYDFAAFSVEEIVEQLLRDARPQVTLAVLAMRDQVRAAGLPVYGEDGRLQATGEGH